MSWRKNKFSYFMWLLYTLFTVAVLMLAAEAQAEKIFGNIPFGGLISGFLIAVLTGLAVYLRQWLIERKKNKAKADTSLSGSSAQNSVWSKVTWEIVVVAALLAVGLILRLDRMLDGQGELSAYYEIAMMTEGQVIPSAIHGVDSLYLQALHLLFLIVGNKFAAAVCLQIILQFLATFMLFMGVRRLAGSAASFVVFGFFMFSGAMIDGAVILSPQMLYLLLFAIGIYFLAACGKSRLNHLAFLGVGIWTGLMGYLDIGGFLLLILLASCAAGERNVESNRRKKLAAFCFGFTGALAGFLGAIWAEASIGGKAFGNVLDAWLGLYSPGGFQLSMLLNDMNTGWWTVVLTVFMMAGVFSFWYDREKDRMSMWVLGVCLSAAAGCFGMFTAELPMYLYLFLFLVVLAGVGIGEIYNAPIENESENMEAALNGDQQMAKKEKKVKRGRNDKREIEVAAAQAQEFQTSVEEPAEIPVVEATSETALPTEVPADSLDAGDQSDKEPKSPKYIENPLPLPKPHVKRTMDYARKPSTDEDDFDLPVNDNDDFDI